MGLFALAQFCFSSPMVIIEEQNTQPLLYVRSIHGQ